MGGTKKARRFPTGPSSDVNTLNADRPLTPIREDEFEDKAHSISSKKSSLNRQSERSSANKKSDQSNPKSSLDKIDEEDDYDNME